MIELVRLKDGTYHLTVEIDDGDTKVSMSLYLVESEPSDSPQDYIVLKVKV